MKYRIKNSVLFILQLIFISSLVWLPAASGGQFGGTNLVRTDCLQGNGILKKENRTPGPFNKVHVNGVFNVQIAQQADSFFEISADANLISNIETRVVDGQLQISSKGSLCPKLPVKIQIGMPELVALQGVGADDISVSNLDNQQFSIQMDGSGDIRVTGRTREFQVMMDGAGNLDAGQFKAGNVSIRSSGAGDAQIFAAEKIDAYIDGVGDITLHGQPEKAIFNSDGVGELIRAD